jgi:hypothetical protein
LAEAFVTLPLPTIKGILRIWVDTEKKPYKIEVRAHDIMGYWNVEDLPKVIIELARVLKNASSD